MGRARNGPLADVVIRAMIKLLDDTGAHPHAVGVLAGSRFVSPPDWAEQQLLVFGLDSHVIEVEQIIE